MSSSGADVTFLLLRKCGTRFPSLSVCMCAQSQRMRTAPRTLQSQEPRDAFRQAARLMEGSNPREAPSGRLWARSLRKGPLSAAAPAAPTGALVLGGFCLLCSLAPVRYTISGPLLGRADCPQIYSEPLCSFLIKALQGPNRGSKGL